jgi:hypothetical protein
MQKNPRDPRPGWDTIPERLGVGLPARVDTIIYDWDQLPPNRVRNDAKTHLVVSQINES